ncbi:hypothetical protein RFI_31213 [Reticulomyxa filosa]|uniref:Uncharacterized protein n=1 Tax=Reticulomyxa filosa TaxID=46433 RepID=X6LW52_RETFI|nr:hypothetical protein RFI_31213 [Reticulomyxa filosa]|eukprot:ETO06183.1 hypothetical protein RFI_31213 [Reticulomyxa filosa]
MIHNLDASQLFHQNQKTFDETCQSLLRGNVCMFGRDWPCLLDTNQSVWKCQHGDNCPPNSTLFQNSNSCSKRHFYLYIPACSACAHSSRYQSHNFNQTHCHNHNHFNNCSDNNVTPINRIPKKRLRKDFDFDNSSFCCFLFLFLFSRLRVLMLRIMVDKIGDSPSSFDCSSDDKTSDERHSFSKKRRRFDSITHRFASISWKPLASSPLNTETLSDLSDFDSSSLKTSKPSLATAPNGKLSINSKLNWGWENSNDNNNCFDSKETVLRWDNISSKHSNPTHNYSSNTAFSCSWNVEWNERQSLNKNSSNSFFRRNEVEIDMNDL